ncbi:hypothetical protein [Ornithobacterium rhinotracheale]|uniref:hypothetical protein n=1 Tax=Ornithobacterium rhinotracheale TaxID=28251 RepID=UPI00403711C0
MKRKLFVLVALFLATIFYAQNVKVKKGEILLDKTPIAKIQKVENRYYQISDLNGNPMFLAMITDQTPEGNTSLQSWLQLKGANGNVVEVEKPDTKFTLSSEKYLINSLLASNTKLLTANGVDANQVNQFFQKEDRSISSAFDELMAEQKAIIQAEEKIAEENELIITKNGEIKSKGKTIGYLKKIVDNSSPASTGAKYMVLDLNKMIVGELSGKRHKDFYTSVTVNLKTYDGKKFPILVSTSKEDLSEDKMARRIVQKLYANGYKLGDMSAEAQAFTNTQNEAAENEAKRNSVNIYSKEGYVQLKNGEKKQGLVTLEFESLDKIMGKNKGLSDITNYGGEVKLTHNGKDEFFKAKNGVKVCVGERCFLGLQGSEDKGVNSNSGSQLSILGESQFFEILYEKSGDYVLSHVKDPNEFYLKLNNNEKAVYLGNKGFLGERKESKTQSIFNKYVNCSSLDFSKYDTKTKDGLIQVIEDYQANCRK